MTQIKTFCIKDTMVFYPWVRKMGFTVNLTKFKKHSKQEMQNLSDS